MRRDAGPDDVSRLVEANARIVHQLQWRLGGSQLQSGAEDKCICARRGLAIGFEFELERRSDISPSELAAPAAVVPMQPARGRQTPAPASANRHPAKAEVRETAPCADQIRIRHPARCRLWVSGSMPDGTLRDRSPAERGRPFLPGGPVLAARSPSRKHQSRACSTSWPAECSRTLKAALPAKR